MKILGVIPARGKSKDVKKKNIKLLNGKPLISYSITAALASKLDQVIVSTDCDKISKISKEFGVNVIKRAPHLAEDETPTLPVIRDVVSKLEKKFDAVMTLQPTSPLRTSEDINNCIDIFKKDKKADSLVSVVKVPHNYMPEKLMRLNNKYLTGSLKIERRQNMKSLYARNGAAIYITRVDRLNEYIFGGNILPYIMSEINSFDIDTLDDWEIIKRII
jgi:N-acylneuraminate cytidylyltransferase